MAGHCTRHPPSWLGSSTWPIQRRFYFGRPGLLVRSLTGEPSRSLPHDSAMYRAAIQNMVRVAAVVIGLILLTAAAVYTLYPRRVGSKADDGAPAGRSEATEHDGTQRSLQDVRHIAGTVAGAIAIPTVGALAWRGWNQRKQVPTGPAKRRRATSTAVKGAALLLGVAGLARAATSIAGHDTSPVNDEGTVKRMVKETNRPVTSETPEGPAPATPSVSAPSSTISKEPQPLRYNTSASISEQWREFLQHGRSTEDLHWIIGELETTGPMSDATIRRVLAKYADSERGSLAGAPPAPTDNIDIVAVHPVVQPRQVRLYSPA